MVNLAKITSYNSRESGRLIRIDIWRHRLNDVRNQLDLTKIKQKGHKNNKPSKKFRFVYIFLIKKKTT